MRQEDASHVWPKMAEESSWWLRLQQVLRPDKTPPVRRSTYEPPTKLPDTPG